MATSGSTNIPVATGLNLVFNWTRTGARIPTNTSTVLWEVLLVNTSSVDLISTANTNILVKVEGSTVFNGQIRVGILNGATRQLATGANINVPHEQDGTKTFTWQVSCQFDVTFNATPVGTIVQNGTGILDPIPRFTQATLVGSPCEFGNTLTINLPQEDPTFTHIITYQFINQTATLTTTAQNIFTWTPPISLANEIPNGSNGSGTLTVVTMDGNDVVGTVRLPFVLVVPSTGAPLISATSLTQATTDIATAFGANTYVQWFSRLRIQLTATAQDGAVIRMVQINVNGQTINGMGVSTGATVINTNVFTDRLVTSGANQVEVVVTDSRGMQSTWTGGIFVTAYGFPNINLLSCQRVTAGNVVDDNGTRMRITYAFSVTQIGATNTPQINARARQAGGAWGVQNNIQSGAYSGTNVQYLHPNTFGIDDAYEIELVISDWFSRNGYRTPTTSNLGYLNTPFVLTDWNNSGRGLAFGGYSNVLNRAYCWNTMPWQFQERALYAGRGATPVNNTLGTTADLNTLVNSGVYWCSGGANRPTSQSGWLMTFNSAEADTNTHCKQIFYLFEGAQGRTYIRQRAVDGTWTPWAKTDALDAFTTVAWRATAGTATGDQLRFTQQDGDTADITFDHFYDSYLTVDTNNNYYLDFDDRSGTRVDRVDLTGMICDVTRVTTTVNFNNYTETGKYYFTQNNCTNAPESGYSSGWLVVIKDRPATQTGNALVKQIWYSAGNGQYGGFNHNSFHTYVRTRQTDGTWMWWKMLDTMERYIPDNTNLNTVRAIGNYYSDASGITNRPPQQDDAFVLTVIDCFANDGSSSNNGCKQIYRHYYWNECHFERTYRGSTWTPWAIVYTSGWDTNWVDVGWGDINSVTRFRYRAKSDIIYIELVAVQPIGGWDGSDIIIGYISPAWIQSAYEIDVDPTSSVSFVVTNASGSITGRAWVTTGGEIHLRSANWSIGNPLYGTVCYPIARRG